MCINTQRDIKDLEHSSPHPKSYIKIVHIILCLSSGPFVGSYAHTQTPTNPHSSFVDFCGQDNSLGN